jgi:hypothetical protein
MLELTQTHTHLKVEGECQIIDTTTGPTRSLVCVVGSPAARAAASGAGSELAAAVAVVAYSAAQLVWTGLCLGLRFAGQLVLTGIGYVGALAIALWLMLLWPLIAELGRLLGIGVFYASGFSGRAISNCLLRAGHSLHARSHVLHAGAALYARLRAPRVVQLQATTRSTSFDRSANGRVLPAKVER